MRNRTILSRALSVALLVLISGTAVAQVAPGPEGVLTITGDVSRFLERQQALGHLPGAHLGAQPLSGFEARRHLDSLALRREALSAADAALLARYRREAAGPNVDFVRRHVPFLYKDGETFASVRDDRYAIHAEPLAYLSLGRARVTSGPEAPDGSAAYWQNTRGARIAGHLGAHVFFEGRVEENQWQVPLSEREFGTAPRFGHVHDFRGAYDYLLATGVVGVHTEFVEVRFGRDRNRWGYGRGSLALSNYAPMYDQLQLRTQVWRLHYTNLYAQFVDRGPGMSGLRPRKAGAFHRLAIHLPGNVELELFEQVVIGPDTTGVRGPVDVAYLNPIILFRAVERDLGSPDNMLLGAGFAWNARPGVRLYGQGILDEFSVRRFREDWWGNKWGYVLGGRLSDPLGLPNLDLQMEYARLRPYLYSHRSLGTAMVHQNDVLGHPVGPNAWDVSAAVAYRPWSTLRFDLDVAYTRRGRNPDGENFGSDPREPYTTRPRERDLSTVMLQGVDQRELLVEARAAYEVLPGLYAEAAVRAESTDDAERGVRRYAAPYATLRWGLPFQSVRY